MTHILHLDSSARGDASHSRQISREFVQAWLRAYPGDTVTYRDLGHQTIPFVTEEFITAMYTPAEARTPEQRSLLALSDELVAELRAADLYVFGVPMYNLSVPAVFKAYVDQIVRANETWDTDTHEGLLKNKKAVFLTARGGGGYGPGGAREAYNFEDPYLRAAFGFVGVTDQTFIHVNNTMRGDDVVNGSLDEARGQIQALVAASVG
jgi:FMN-dependent NADH-azoreductase